MASQVSVVLSSWNHYFDKAEFTPKEFYESVESIVKNRKIEDVKTSHITYSESGLFSAKREYLRISFKEYVFDICAAPYGTGFFVSWWLGETTGFLRELLAKIPVIGNFLAKASKLKTYYQMDTENMFKQSVRNCVLEAIDVMTKQKGLRELSEFERRESHSVK